MDFQRDITLVQGKRFVEVLRFALPTRIYRRIASAPAAAPLVIATEDPHGLTEGWPYWIRGAQGLKALNRPEPWLAKLTSATQLELNELNGALLDPYTANSGWVEYLQPADLSGRTGRLKIRADYDSPQLLGLTDVDGIAIDAAAQTVTITLTAAQTAALTLPGGVGVWDLELPAAGDVVDLYVRGAVSLQREVTYP